MRFAIVGCGVIASAHAEAIHGLEDAELTAVASREADAARDFADRYQTKAESSVETLLRRPDVDAIAVCVPSGLHADIAVAALDAGKHVVVEKPLDITLDAADRIIDAENRSGRTVTTISQRRFEPGPAFLHRAISAGALGRLTSGAAECTWWRSQAYYDSAGWRGTWSMDGGGALMNQGIHQADMLVWMLGQPVEVMADAGMLAHRDLEVEDTVAAVVRFESGAIATLTATTAANPGLPLRLSVNGDGGLAIIEGSRLATFELADPDAKPSSTLVDPGTAAATAAAEAGDAEPTDERSRLEREARTVKEAQGRAGGMNHPAQYADFLDAVQHGRAPAVTTLDGRRALELVLGVYVSARTRTPVPLGPARD